MQGFAELVEVVVGDARIVCIGTLTVDAGEFNRKDRMSAREACDPVLANDDFGLYKILHLHLPLTPVVGVGVHCNVWSRGDSCLSIGHLPAASRTPAREIKATYFIFTSSRGSKYI